MSMIYIHSIWTNEKLYGYFNLVQQFMMELNDLIGKIETRGDIFSIKVDANTYSYIYMAFE